MVEVTIEMIEEEHRVDQPRRMQRHHYLELLRKAESLKLEADVKVDVESVGREEFEYVKLPTLVAMTVKVEWTK